MDFEIGQTEVAFCPHCGNNAPQKLVYNQFYTGLWYSGKSGKKNRNFNEPPLFIYHIAVCQTCDEVLIYNEYLGDDGADNFTKTDLYWPETGLHKSVPDSVSSCYAEAESIKHVAPNAFATQIRKALEALCDDRKAKGTNLHARLLDLVYISK